MVGADLEVVTRAANAAKQTDFVVYLATLKRIRVMECNCKVYAFDFGPHEHDSEDGLTNAGEIDDNWRLKKIATLDGTHVAEDFRISKHEMIDYEALDGAEAYREEHSDWMGDERTETTLWYKISVSG
jgi:hypothetical protein